MATPIQPFANGFFGPSKWEVDVDYDSGFGPISRLFVSRKRLAWRDSDGCRARPGASR